MMLQVMSVSYTPLDVYKRQELYAAKAMLGNVESILLNGAKFILDKVYDSIGFNRVDDNVLRHLVVARLCHPCLLYTSGNESSRNI